VPPTYSELIDIQASGPSVEYLPSLLSSMLESDQPACAWWATPPTFGPTWERMARVCDRIVVDSQQLDPWDLMRLVEFVKSDTAELHTDDHAALGDLAWARVKPFMALTARFFDSDAVREKLGTIDRVRIRHAPPDGQGTAIGAALLGAWLRERLQKAARLARVKVAPRVELEAVKRKDLEPGDVAELVLSGGDALELAVTRPESNTSVLAEARKGVAGLPSQRLRMHTHKSWLLAQELKIYGRDPLFERALLGAIDILREARQ
jgi:glucose-6-phosphate dehydrogenase assembly protein OpcA